ncbi:MAG: Trk system potassium transporter TrkA [Elusimicrobiales bacterium]|nr:Trk system potassium transporter TrkA [Elusimicrobiales bacterium]
MYIVIVGAGEVGSHLARVFVSEGHEVAVIEQDAELAARLDASLDALVVAGSGVNPAVLRQAGVKRADLILAVTAGDEVNLIACMTARKYGPSSLRAVARVRQARHMAGGLSLSAGDLGLDALVSPEESIADSIEDTLRFTGSGEMRELAGGALVLVGMSLGPDSPLIHETLAQIREDLPKDCLVAAIHGAEGVRIPSGDDRIQEDERAVFLTLPAHLTELAILSGNPWHYIKRVLLIGCGNTGLSVARELENQGFSLTIVEKDKSRAEYVAGLLEKSMILNGDGSDPDFLRERIEEGKIDAALVLLKDPEKSLLVGIFAKSLGAGKVVVRCDKLAYEELAGSHGVDAIISQKRAMTDSIARYVRRGRVKSAMLLGEHEAEVMNLKVPEKPAEPDLLLKPLKDLKFPPGSIIGAVIRGAQPFIADGETILRPGDDVFVVCLESARAEAEAVFN